MTIRNTIAELLILLCIELPSVVLIACPAMVAGYLFCWAQGGWAWGVTTFEGRAKRSNSKTYKVNLTSNGN